MFEDRTTETIKAEILARLGPETGVSTREGSYADGTAGPVAQAISRLYKALPAVVSMLFIDESSGPFIDRVAGDYHGLTRREGTKARCAVTLTGDGGTVVPAGTVFLTGSGLRFLLLADVTISLGGSAVGELEAEETGAAYNVEAGAITRMYVNLRGLTAWQNEVAEGGADDESDAALFARVDEARRRPATSGNGWDYRRWALEVEGVGEAKVVELAHGPGTVELTLADSAYKAPDERIVAAVLAHVTQQKPIGATPTVKAAQALTVTITATVSVLGTSADEVHAAMEDRAEEYLRTLIQTKYRTIYYAPAEDKPYTILYNRMLALLLSIQGVENFGSLTVNGGTEDITVPADAIPVLGEVSVTEVGA